MRSGVTFEVAKSLFTMVEFITDQRDHSRHTFLFVISTKLLRFVKEGPLDAHYKY